MHMDGEQDTHHPGSRERAISGRIRGVSGTGASAAFHDLVGDRQDGHKIVGKGPDDGRGDGWTAASADGLRKSICFYHASNVIIVFHF
jgi:hypothetical protein